MRNKISLQNVKIELGLCLWNEQSMYRRYQAIDRTFLHRASFEMDAVITN